MFSPSQSERGPASRCRGQGAFTLVELLVVIVIVAVLAGLLLPVFGSVRLRADRAFAVGQMRQIYAGITLYAGEHNNRFPGPLWPGQVPATDPAETGRLTVLLASYLGIPVPATAQLVPLFIPPAYQRKMGATFMPTARTYVMNMAVAGSTGGVLCPWGNVATTSQPPIPLAQVGLSPMPTN